MNYDLMKITGIIYRIFQAEEFKWAILDFGTQIPSYEEIEKTIKDLLKDIKKNKLAETGRIRIEKDGGVVSFYLEIGNLIIDE